MNYQIILFATLFTVSCASGIPESPCPDVWQFERHGGKLFGKITVPRNSDDVYNVSVRTIFGEHITGDLSMHTISSVEDFLSAPKIIYEVKFPSHKLTPRLEKVEYNNELICKNTKHEDLYPGISMRSIKSFIKLVQRPSSDWQEYEQD